MNLLVTPIYGYGWFSGEQSIGVPSPFAIAVTGEPSSAAIGKLEISDHPLAGKWIFLSPRRSHYNGDCNLFAFDNKPDMTKPLAAKPAASGFASVKELD